jgi:hypothetical protein
MFRLSMRALGFIAYFQSKEIMLAEDICFGRPASPQLESGAL